MLKRFFSIFCVWLAFCGALAYEVRIPIVASGDLHGELARLEAGIGPALAEIGRKEGVLPIYCDLGDVAEGHLSMLRSRGAGVMAALNRAGAVVWVPGNHDVSFGLGWLAKAMQDFHGTVLAGNLRFPEAAGRFQPFVIVERAGFRIALIGMMLKNMNGSLPVPESRFQTLPALDALPQVMAEVRNQHPDAIVLLRHAGVYGGGENLADVLAAAPGIDLVIGSHTHRAEPGRMVRNSWYVQPGAHAESLAEAVLIFDGRSRKLKQIESHLLLLPAVSGADPALEAPAPPLVNAPDSFAADAMRRALHTDAAIYAVGNQEAWRKLCAEPAPTAGDYACVFAYFDPVVSAEVSAAEWKAILQEYVPFAAERKMLLSMAGGRFMVKNKRLEMFQPDTEKPRYTLAVTAYVAAGAGGKLPVTRAILAGRIAPAALDAAPPLLDLLLP